MNRILHELSSVVTNPREETGAGLLYVLYVIIAILVILFLLRILGIA